SRLRVHCGDSSARFCRKTSSRKSRNTPSMLSLERRGESSRPLHANVHARKSGGNPLRIVSLFTVSRKSPDYLESCCESLCQSMAFLALQCVPCCAGCHASDLQVNDVFQRNSIEGPVHPASTVPFASVFNLCFLHRLPYLKEHNHRIQAAQCDR